MQEGMHSWAKYINLQDLVDCHCKDHNFISIVPILNLKCLLIDCHLSIFVFSAGFFPFEMEMDLPFVPVVHMTKMFTFM